VKFPGIAVPFPEQGGIFAQFGQNPRFSGLINVEFAAKFPEAGNLKLRQVSQFLDLPSDRFPRHWHSKLPPIFLHPRYGD
jgi:hypothetical protein